MVCRIWAGNEFSHGAKLLAQTMKIPRIRHSGPQKIPIKPGDTIINWGGTRIPDEFQHGTSFILNEPSDIRRVSNKLMFFQTVHEVCRCVPFFTDANEIIGHLDQKKKVMARTILNGHSGDGIVVIEKDVDIVTAPLYTVYVPKKYEFRVHVVNHDIVDVQRKIKRPDFEGEVDWTIRNHQGGFIYVRNGVRDMCPPDVLEQAQLAVEATGLQFGAVDVLYNDKEQRAYVLEINSAPGLEGLTVQMYAESIRKNYREVLHLPV